MNGPPVRNKPPHNANVLGRWLTESANHSGIAVRWQIAQKLHACTERLDDVRNDRFRDLLDLQLLAGLMDDVAWPAVRVACVEVRQISPSRTAGPTATTPSQSTLASRWTMSIRQPRPFVASSTESIGRATIDCRLPRKRSRRPG